MAITLVTGGTGLVGYNVIQALLKRGRRVRAMVRNPDRARSILKDVDFMAGDITDVDAVRRGIEGCSVVYHCAGLPEQWLKDNAVFERVNVGGTRNIAEAARVARVKKFVYTSTIDVFQAAAGEEYDESKLDPDPKGTAYERSKQAADRVVVELYGRGLPAVFLHPAGVYGVGPAGSPGINQFLIDYKAGKVPAILPGGMPVVFGPDVGEGHVLAEEKARNGARYILSESYMDFKELAAVAGSLLGKKGIPFTLPLWLAKTASAATEIVAGMTGRPPLIPSGQLHFLQWQARPKSDKAKKELGWNPVTAREGLEKTIQALGL
ncbi:MAG: NAD-dependent epimerase/dehydratase family protein [Spirochaetia bacterium]|nr:NAD-dependent epimerase/dehydratase family protein [Spirochaetia bacterium]